MKRPRPRFTIEVGILLHEGRLRKGVTLREVEAATTISNAYVSQLESGYIREPSPVILKDLADFYGISYRKLFDAAGYPRP